MRTTARHHAGRTLSGFTLVESAVALLMIAMAAVVMIGRNQEDVIELAVQRDLLEKHLRAAQMRAMQGGGINTVQGGTVGQVYGLKCDGASYWMFAGTNPDANGAVVPLLDDASVTLASGKLSLTAKKISLGAFTVYFDGYGVPCSAYIDESTKTLVPAAQTYTVTMKGMTRTVTLTPYTGFIQ